MPSEEWNFSNSSFVFHTSTMFLSTDLEKRRIVRLMLESFEVAFQVCNLYLERYGFGKLFDIVNQIMPTAYILNSGYWIFYSCKNGDSICVCARFGIRCPHIRNEHHWLNMEAYQETEQEFIFKSGGGVSRPDDCSINILPIVTNNFTGFDVRITMTIPNPDESSESTLRNLAADARYAVLPERVTQERAQVMFTPHPLTHPNYAQYFTSLLSFWDTCDLKNQFPRNYTVGLYGCVKLTRSNNDGVASATDIKPKLTICKNLYNKPSHYLNHLLSLAPTNGVNIQNVYMMTNTYQYQLQNSETSNRNARITQIPPPRLYPYQNSQAQNVRDQNLRQQNQHFRNHNQRLMTTPRPSNSSNFTHHVDTPRSSGSDFVVPQPPTNYTKRSNRRGSRRGRQVRQVTNREDPPETGQALMYNNHPQYMYSHPQYTYPRAVALPPPYPYPFFQSNPQYMQTTWKSEHDSQRDLILSHSSAPTPPPNNQNWQGFANTYNNNFYGNVMIKQEPLPYEEFTIKQEPQEQPEESMPNFYGEKYHQEFPELPPSQGAIKKQKTIHHKTACISTIDTFDSTKAVESAVKEKNDRVADLLGFNPLLDDYTNDLLNTITEVIEEDLMKEQLKKVQKTNETHVLTETFSEIVEHNYSMSTAYNNWNAASPDVSASSDIMEDFNMKNPLIGGDSPQALSPFSFSRKIKIEPPEYIRCDSPIVISSDED